ncbi:MAG: hypothetical protein CMJ20_01170 [Phycisphaeraceae bacterium]|nr:hypothetical protein [Phycisphaeraceae bacterium]
MHSVPVMGSASVIRQAICHELCTRGYHVHGFDIQPIGGSVSKLVKLSITDPQPVCSAMEGMDGIVHRVFKDWLGPAASGPLWTLLNITE